MRLFALLLGCCLTASASGGALVSVSDLHRGTVGEWQFEEASGTVTGDMSGNANTGTLSGSMLPNWTNGVVGNALNFDGANSYVSLTNTGPLPQTTNYYTIAAWIKSTGAGGTSIQQIFALESNGNHQPMSFYLYDGKLTAEYFDLSLGDAYARGSTDLRDSKWHHVAGVRSGSSFNVYVDGKSDKTSGNDGASTFSITGTASIGCEAPANSNFFVGRIDDVLIYNRALSATEVLNLYCQGGGRTP